MAFSSFKVYQRLKLRMYSLAFALLLSKASGGAPNKVLPSKGAGFWGWVIVVEMWGSTILRCSDSKTAALRCSASVSMVKEWLATTASKICEVMGASGVSGVKGVIPNWTT
jgi:hypothetical protein